MTSIYQGILALAGRVLLAHIFLLSGIGKITAYHGTIAYMAQNGVPVPDVLIIPAIFAEIVGGLALILGWFTRTGAWGLILFVILATLYFHDFWTMAPDQVQNQMIHFQKNLAIIGGLLYLAAFGPGRYSVEASRY